MNLNRKLVNAFQECSLDCSGWHEEVLEELAKIALKAIKDPTDKELLAPGEPYQVRREVLVPRKQGIQLRREAWNKIVDHVLENC